MIQAGKIKVIRFFLITFTFFSFSLATTINIDEILSEKNTLRLTTQLSYINIKNKDAQFSTLTYSLSDTNFITLPLVDVINSNEDYLNVNLALRYGINNRIEILDFLFPDIKDFTQKQEISFLDLANFSKSKGFKALGLSLDFPTLLEVKVPVIVYLLTRKNQHFSVFIGADKNFIYLADPSFGNIKIKHKKFKEMFTPKEKQGKVLAIFPKTKIKEIMLDSKKSNHINENIKNKMIY